MFRNPLSILFSVINLPEPAITEEDTAEFVPVEVAPEPPVMHTAPIVLGEIYTPDSILGHLVAYRMDRASEWQVGNIRAFEEGRFGVKVLFQPVNRDLCAKWRYISEVYFAWYE